MPLKSLLARMLRCLYRLPGDTVCSDILIVSGEDLSLEQSLWEPALENKVSCQSSTSLAHTSLLHRTRAKLVDKRLDQLRSIVIHRAIVRGIMAHASAHAILMQRVPR